MKKATMRQSDEFYEAIEPGDIQLLKKAQFYTLAAPVVTIGGMYLLNKLRADVMMSKHFLYIIKKYQGNFQDKYKRDNDAQD